MIICAALLWTLTACSTGTAPPAPEAGTTTAIAPTVTVTAPPSTVASTPPLQPTLPVTPSWPLTTDVEGAAPSPEFPTELDGWQPAEEWTALPRVTTGGAWVQPAGPTGDEFGDTMNGCAKQRFLIRWRALNSDAVVLARSNMQDADFSEPTSANAGWMDVNGCRAPEFSLTGDGLGEGSLADIAVSVQRWTPAA